MKTFNQFTLTEAMPLMRIVAEQQGLKLSVLRQFKIAREVVEKSIKYN